MIKVTLINFNQTKFEVKEIKVDYITYPDDTESINMDLEQFREGQDYPPSLYSAHISYYYESPKEYLNIGAIVHALRACGFVEKVFLTINYMPNARMDRVKSINEAFTLKAFTNYINSLPIDKVFILDPHSKISEVLLDKCCTHAIDFMERELIKHIEKSLGELLFDNVFYLAFPDAGAQKRYQDLVMKTKFKDKIVGTMVGDKTRNWKTGKIEKLSINFLHDGKLNEYANTIILDDICSKGGTFKYFIEEAKKISKNFKFHLFVTHLEPAVLEGELFQRKEEYNLQTIFTTSSLKYLWKRKGYDMDSYRDKDIYVRDLDKMFM